MYHFNKWRHALLIAPDRKAVAAIMVEYVAAILPSDLAQLPSSCQKIVADPGIDIPFAAVTLLQTELAYEGPPEAAAILHEIAHTYVAASTRLTQLHGRAEPIPSR